MIELTGPNNGPKFWVNPEYIVYLSENTFSKETRILTTVAAFECSESIKEILEASNPH